jgi:hypothetical protein
MTNVGQLQNAWKLLLIGILFYALSAEFCDKPYELMLLFTFGLLCFLSVWNADSYRREFVLIKARRACGVYSSVLHCEVRFGLSVKPVKTLL